MGGCATTPKSLGGSKGTCQVCGTCQVRLMKASQCHCEHLKKAVLFWLDFFPVKSEATSEICRSLSPVSEQGGAEERGF